MPFSGSHHFFEWMLGALCPLQWSVRCLRQRMCPFFFSYSQHLTEALAQSFCSVSMQGGYAVTRKLLTEQMNVWMCEEGTDMRHSDGNKNPEPCRLSRIWQKDSTSLPGQGPGWEQKKPPYGEVRTGRLGITDWRKWCP